MASEFVIDPGCTEMLEFKTIVIDVLDTLTPNLQRYQNGLPGGALS